MTAEEFTNAHPALTEFWHSVALACDIGSESVAARPGRPGLGAGASGR